MKKAVKGIISIILTISILSVFAVTAFAASDDEVYLSDLRIIYAETYDEAKLILSETKLEGYTVYNRNLNSNSNEIGVWLAYKTTLNIEDAITDISVMQMGGGYTEGNYQQMIENSRLEYLTTGKIYLEAIKYFTKAYEANDFLATSAYRQLNFYSGLDDYGAKKLGDIMISGRLTDSDLATFFLQGNSYVLDNVRSLLAMGVSYNEDGMHYLERVGQIVSEMGEGEGYEPFEVVDVEISLVDEDDLILYSKLIAPTISVFRTMFEELSAYDAELNYEDEEFTDLELKYAEYKAIAETMRTINYLDGKTLYDFCMEYELDTEDYTAVYPLAAALNDGQAAMAKAAHYYDVVRYSMTEVPEEAINAELTSLEKTYGETPFNVYTGVDRSVFKGNFAVTSAASRADAYTDSNSLMDALFGGDSWKATTVQILAGAVGVGLFVGAIVRTAKGGFGASAEYVKNLTDKAIAKANVKINGVFNQAFMQADLPPTWMDATFKELESYYQVAVGDAVKNSWETATLYQKMDTLNKLMTENGLLETVDGRELTAAYEQLKPTYDEAYKSGMDAAKSSIKFSVLKARLFTGALYILGAASLAYSAYTMYKQIYDYYHPTYDVIPEALVDLVRTAEGDRYIKYDVVLEAQPKENGDYAAADLNAFEGQRWNALYFTKSYEAGKPLLASFTLSNTDNQADEGYLPVHRFGEGVCYDLNKYNFSSSSDNIFLSIKQSENQKSAVADVPAVVGSLFGGGFVFIAAIAGAGVGIGATVGVQAALKKKKKADVTE